MLAITAFQIAAPALFEHPAGGGINWTQTLFAGLTGGIGAALGGRIGKAFAPTSRSGSPSRDD